MKKIICDFCNGESNKDTPFEFQMFSLKMPKYAGMAIITIDVDICAKCYADIFNTPFIQDKLQIIYKNNIDKLWKKDK